MPQKPQRLWWGQSHTLHLPLSAVSDTMPTGNYLGKTTLQSTKNKINQLHALFHKPPYERIYSYPTQQKLNFVVMSERSVTYLEYPSEPFPPEHRFSQDSCQSFSPTKTQSHSRSNNWQEVLYGRLCSRC